MRPLRLLFALACLLAPGPLAADWAAYCPAESEGAVELIETSPFGQGLLWRVEPPGGGRPNWVFGTMHLDLPAVTTLPAPAAAAFGQSNRLVVEVVLDAAAQADYARRMLLPGEQRLNEFLPAALYARYIELARRYGLGITQAARLTPWAAVNLVGRPKPTTGVVLDEALQREALARGLPVSGLESMEELVGSLEALDTADQVAMLTDALCAHERVMESVPEQVARYLEGDLAALAALSAPPEADAARAARFLETLLYARNARMRDRLVAALGEGGVFVAVGALHLPGERGLLRLLEGSGFVVTPGG